MKCPQIPMEKTSSQKSAVIALRIQLKVSAEGITLNYHKCHYFQRAKSIIIKGHFFIKIRWHQQIDLQTVPAESKCPHILIFRYLQKENAKCPRISDKKKVLPL